MKGVMVDTNVFISFLRKGDLTLIDLVSYAVSRVAPLFVPTVVIFELFVGKDAEKEKKRQQLEEVLKDFVLVDFNEEVAKKAAEIQRRDLRPKGRVIELADLIIGATALVLNAELATLNKKHFLGIPNLDLFDFKRLKE